MYVQPMYSLPLPALGSCTVHGAALVAQLVALHRKRSQALHFVYVVDFGIKVVDSCSV
jgi:hypothetical protein